MVYWEKVDKGAFIAILQCFLMFLHFTLLVPKNQAQNKGGTRVNVRMSEMKVGSKL